VYVRNKNRTHLNIPKKNGDKKTHSFFTMTVRSLDDEDK
jgi:hypothetical protein